MSAHIRFDQAGFVDLGKLAELGARPIESKNDAIDAVARYFTRAVRDNRLDSVLPHTNTMRLDAVITDAAENFYTHNLAVQLDPIQRMPPNQFYMVPGEGSAQLLPVRNSLPSPGHSKIEYDIEAPTGQASWVDPEGMRKLAQVGEFAERKTHETDWCGIGYGWGLIESWRAAASGRRLDMTRPNTATMYLRRFAERVLLYGDVQHKMDGLINHPAAYIQSLNTSFASITDPDDALEQLQIMDYFFKRMTQTYGGAITGIAAPLSHQYALQRLRYSGDTQFAWPQFRELINWLDRIVFIDGLDTAGSTGGPVWIAWADDANELWSEMDAFPMIFGPWDDELRMSFAMIQHVGGVICRRRERVARFEFAA